MDRSMENPASIPAPIPKRNLLNHVGEGQWSILAALADTVIPSLVISGKNKLLQQTVSQNTYEASSRRIRDLVASDGSESLVSEYLNEGLTSAPDFKDDMLELVNMRMPKSGRKDLIFVLNLLSSRAGAALLTGYVTPLDRLPVHTREQILQGWAASRLPLLRNLHRSLTTAFKMLWSKDSKTLSRVIDFSYRPTEQPHVGPTYPFNFVQPSSSSGSGASILTTDVIIVGSGCGGAVAAKTIAEAGINVIVADKGYYWSPNHLPMSLREGSYHLFQNGCVQQTDETSMTIVAGSTWGGGGTINWSASLQTEGMVRRDWASQGLPYFTSSAFQSDMDAVCDRMGVGLSAVEHNKGNQALLDGARKLGWAARPIPQNTGGEAHNCGHCTLGCGSCGKKGPTETFLPDAARAGAQLLEGFECQQVIWEGKRAVGVRGYWTAKDDYINSNEAAVPKREVIIKAKKVIVSGGTLNSPLVLKRSGISNAQVGRNLHLHPVSMVAAVWDQAVRPWDGAIMTAVVSEFSNLDNAGHGVKMEATCMLPSLLLPFFPWRSGLQYKELAAKMKYMTGYIALTRDKDTGVVYPDPVDGRCRVDYTVSNYDRAHILEGVVRLSEILYIEGAKEIHTAITEVEPFIRGQSTESGVSPSLNDDAFKQWTKLVRTTGLRAPQSNFASAHQMGTCRMGSSSRNSAVNSKGKVWDKEGLYVCDASVLPSASGVNPMITTMGICRGIARGIVEEMSTRAKL
ncbi:GMC oxidoreductase [Polychaeton citri CBS 116435]|uniref:Long-chain-alcohol oxidase n=1 Tax=Polychaeton citri CBS 116435 TaxID=1314669 RepID=A0A9P4Q6S5_9PEZI|nr:GMC oxidoreductase [Polychaeton citri CBS 116435]